MYECFHCGERAVIWDGDFDSEDYGYEEPGIIHECHCINSGAQLDGIWQEKGMEENQKYFTRLNWLDWLKQEVNNG